MAIRSVRQDVSTTSPRREVKCSGDILFNTSSTPNCTDGYLFLLKPQLRSVYESSPKFRNKKVITDYYDYLLQKNMGQSYQIFVIHRTVICC
ncbi:hypothetical protein CEXT_801191 [Caerostris extrusa]|uniref:Uncharacterized protein n=1 Tax=Caerostris extrusa TaxID=172846 RepID=A0AAV4NEW7_CAEEX|nr:hypothetical protein CEXT_801191 [Caerostris extrusa]